MLYEVITLALVRSIVREHLGGAADVLAVHRVLDKTLDGDRDGLIHLVADDAPDDRSYNFV